MRRIRVLVVEDDWDIREMVRRLLVEEGFEVITAADGVTGLAAASYGVDAVVLDLGLPAMDGFELLWSLRQKSALPILILSAREDGSDKVKGLDLGADDYLIKPFLPPELIARLKALLRRTQNFQDDGLVIDGDARRVYMDGRPVELTGQEFQVLQTLADARGRNLTRQELLERAWVEHPGSPRQVDHYISRLRAKLKPDIIRSVWGVGYRLEP